MDLDGWTQSERESLKWQGERWRVETWSYQRSGWQQRDGEPVTGEAVRERHVRQRLKESQHPAKPRGERETES